MKSALGALIVLFGSSLAFAQAKVMNPGEAVGQLVYLSASDVLTESDKYLSLNPLSIPVFEELPLDLAVVMGTITLKPQYLLSHVQLKARARGTPNLDLSALPGGMGNEILLPHADGSWVRMNLSEDGTILFTPATEAEALAFHEAKQLPPVTLRLDLSETRILRHEEIDWTALDRVGSKAANYAELMRALNTPERTVVRPGFALPFYYYQQFVSTNPAVEQAIERLLRDPLMNRVVAVRYREEKLSALRELMESEVSIVPQDIVNQLIDTLDQVRSPNGLPRRMKLRSSTNAEDLPNFNGAGLYSSESYKPSKDDKEKSRVKKEESLRKALRTVWASIWRLVAYEERQYFNIPHGDVRMAVQINPTFANEGVDGVIVTKNVSGHPTLTGAGVYIEAQRGDDYSVANPISGIRPETILVLIDRSEPLNKEKYQINILQKSNIADDRETIMATDNPNPIMSDEEIKDLVFQCLKAEAHFKPLLDAENPDFSLDLEFKVDDEDTGARQVYIKQARPYID